MKYIDSIEIEKYDKKIKLKRINYRKSFIEEYAQLLYKNAVNDQIKIYDESENKIHTIYTTLPQYKNDVRK